MLRFGLVVIAVVLVAVAGVLGWQYVSPPTPTGPPDWYGKVVAVVPGGDQAGGVVLELKPHPSAEGRPVDPDRATYKEVRADFTARTPVRRPGGKDAKPTDLRVGQTVSVWCDGPFYERAPPTRAAGSIVIED
jgi:hypothetical protein